MAAREARQLGRGHEQEQLYWLRCKRTTSDYNFICKCFLRISRINTKIHSQHTCPHPSPYPSGPVVGLVFGFGFVSFVLPTGVRIERRVTAHTSSWPDQPTSVNFNEVSNGSSSFATHPLLRPPTPLLSNSCRHDFLAAFFICFCFCCCNCVFIAGCCCAGISHCLCGMVGVLNEASGVFQRPRIPTSCAALFEGC